MSIESTSTSNSIIATAQEKAPERDSNAALFATAAFVGGAALLASQRPAHSAANISYAQIDGTGDTKVLNYALALEALEADLYDQCLKRLTGGGTNALGVTIPGLGLGASRPSVVYVRSFGQVEVDHRNFLNGRLGAASIIGPSGSLRNARFDFGIQTKSEREILDLLVTVEGLGVQAYLGAIPLFATATFLPIAAAIQGTEARHTAAVIVIRNQLFGTTTQPAPLFNEGLQNKGIDVPLGPDPVLQAAGQFIVL